MLVAILEPDASRFSVPSKVLTYLCAGRAIVGVLPPDNSVAEILSTQGAGLVVTGAGRRRGGGGPAPRRRGGRRAMGRAGRRYAERAFDPETAADRFLEIFGARAADCARRRAARSDRRPAGDATAPDLDYVLVGGQSDVEHGRHPTRARTTDDKVAAIWAVPPSRWVIEDREAFR